MARPSFGKHEIRARPQRLRGEGCPAKLQRSRAICTTLPHHERGGNRATPLYWLHGRSSPTRRRPQRRQEYQHGPRLRTVSEIGLRTRVRQQTPLVGNTVTVLVPPFPAGRAAGQGFQPGCGAGVLVLLRRNIHGFFEKRLARRDRAPNPARDFHVNRSRQPWSPQTLNWVITARSRVKSSSRAPMR